MSVILNNTVYVSEQEHGLIKEAFEPTKPLTFDMVYTAWRDYPIVVVPEWPEKIELDDGWWVTSIGEVATAWHPDKIREGLERALRESSFFPRPVVQDYASVGLYQQQTPRWPGAFW